MKKPIYLFIIDLNERGVFRCHVECKDTGKIIFNADNEYSESGQLDLIEDGFMKNIRDMSGLQDYLRKISLITNKSEIEYVG